jgi:hypothetical protein
MKQENDKILSPISVMRILILRGFVTEMPHLFHFLPWAAVHSDLRKYEIWFYHLSHGYQDFAPMELLVEGGEIEGVSHHFGVEDSHS